MGTSRIRRMSARVPPIRASIAPDFGGSASQMFPMPLGEYDSVNR